MTNRREFLQIGVSATAWPLVARAVQAAGLEPAVPTMPLAAVVYDTRFPHSVAFGERAAALGMTRRAIEGDMTRLWYDEIRDRWRQGPVAIAGLTAHGPMFCFAELARDVRLRIVFRAEHRVHPRAPVSHRIAGPVSMLSESVAACRGVAFAPAMAEIVARCPQGRCEMSSATVGPVGVEADDDALYTWVIAPASGG